ncbi:MAG TPA: hypothetical protein VFU83_03470 [Pyrinomonadaceae bacterium]|nr:hypothetical protein [Pyrinomonadaceae bacterium]
MSLNQLDKLKTEFGPKQATRVEALLDRLSRRNFRDPDELLHYHELLLFVRAYPHNAAVARKADAQLRTFPRRISQLREQDIDLTSLESPEVSGIAGMSVTDTFSYYIVRWLARTYPAQVALDWEWFEDENRLAQAWPRFIPFLEEDASVEANVPYREWLSAARAGRSELSWLIECFNGLAKPEKEKVELYDSQQLYVRWIPRFRSTRTGLRTATSKLFIHRGPLIQRRDIRLHEELDQPLPELRKLRLQQGEKALDLAREGATIRYRELYGFTHGDPQHVYHADLGRGTKLFVFGLPAEKRLPLRAYHAATIYKNGVPVGYFEGLSIFERMESGFNLYYTFRDGETAWLYARILNVMRHLFGVTTFAIDPYQIGFENEEGIESGAFWFYRKLGFRPVRQEVLELVEKEEQKIANRSGYRTPARTLRRLAESLMIFELDKKQAGDWDRFQVRKIGFRAAREKAKHFTELLNLKSWSYEDKKLLERVVRAKTSAEETTYLKLMQRHERLRREIIRLGS